MNNYELVKKGIIQIIEKEDNINENLINSIIKSRKELSQEPSYSQIKIYIEEIKPLKNEEWSKMKNELKEIFNYQINFKS